MRQTSGRGAATPRAQYSNYFEVGNNALEFMIDFGQFYSEHAAAQRHTRIVTGPAFAKLLLRLLTDAVAQHEAAYGTILLPDEPDPLKHVRTPIENSKPQQGKSSGSRSR